MEPIVHPIAQMAVEAAWPAFLSHPNTLVFMIPIAAILVGGVMGVAKLVMRHRERMAMIERGIDPDQSADPEE